MPVHCLPPPRALLCAAGSPRREMNISLSTFAHGRWKTGKPMAYLLAVDGGGTKTEFALMEPGRQNCAPSEPGPSNYQNIGATRLATCCATDFPKWRRKPGASCSGRALVWPASTRPKTSAFTPPWWATCSATRRPKCASKTTASSPCTAALWARRHRDHRGHRIHGHRYERSWRTPAAAAGATVSAMKAAVTKSVTRRWCER